jgi:PPK2 family polyphosphate:nucleotide phosphotransferase
MRLLPVSLGRRPPLGAREALPPPGLPSPAHGATEPILADLTALQEALHAEGKRVLLVVLQGRDAAGKDGTIHRVCQAFDPQGVTITPFRVPTTTEVAHDYLWRVHAAVPPRGMVGVFNRSHYEDVLVPRVHRTITRGVWQARYREINDFERMLGANGVTIVKFFLHVSRGEQRRRLLARLTDPRKNWKIDAADIAERRHWDAYTRAYRDLLARCSTPWAPWYVVPANDKHARDYMFADVRRATLRRMAPRIPRADRRSVTRLIKQVH